MSPRRRRLAHPSGMTVAFEAFLAGAVMDTADPPERPGLRRADKGGRRERHGREVQDVVDARVDPESGERRGAERNVGVGLGVQPKSRKPPQEESQSQE